MGPDEIPLPEAWPKLVCRALRYVASLAHYATIQSRCWCANCGIERVSMAGRLERADQELAVERDLNRIKTQRMGRIPAQQRPRYKPKERMEILTIRAQQGWTKAETARTFLVSDDTITSWETRLESAEETNLLKPPEPVNKYPDFITTIAHQMNRLCPVLGTEKAVQFLARAGLHLAGTTFGRKLREQAPVPPKEEKPAPSTERDRKIIANYPRHVWHCDLTQVPITGTWTPWTPFAKPQCWPFVYWVIVVTDHFSRACMGFHVQKTQPKSEELTAFLEKLIQCRGQPKYIISDQGKQFTAKNYRSWCKKKKKKIGKTRIWPRFGALKKHGSIAVVERFILSMKNEGSRRITVSMNIDEFRKELDLYTAWYNYHRPHETLEGKTPFEVYAKVKTPANQQRRFEPRKKWPLESRCAGVQARVKGKRGGKLELEVRYLEGRRHLPLIELKRVS